jgi:hypothetical protein
MFDFFDRLIQNIKKLKYISNTLCNKLYSI